MGCSDAEYEGMYDDEYTVQYYYIFDYQDDSPDPDVIVVGP